MMIITSIRRREENQFTVTERTTDYIIYTISDTNGDVGTYIVLYITVFV